MEGDGVRKSVDQLIKIVSDINGLSLSLIRELMTSSDSCKQANYMINIIKSFMLLLTSIVMITEPKT